MGHQTHSLAQPLPSSGGGEEAPSKGRPGLATLFPAGVALGEGALRTPFFLPGSPSGGLSPPSVPANWERELFAPIPVCLITQLETGHPIPGTDIQSPPPTFYNAGAPGAPQLASWLDSEGRTFMARTDMPGEKSHVRQGCLGALSVSP